MDVAVIGCVVNGPGEAKAAEIGLTGGIPNLLYVDGKPNYKVDNESIVDELEKEIRQRIARQQNNTHPDKFIPIKDIS